MIKILKRLSEYTLDEFKQFCYQNDLDPQLFMPYIRKWAIEEHELELKRFIRFAGPNTIVKVSGTVCLDHKHYKVKERILTLEEAFDAMITPDAQDYCITLSLQNKYYVLIHHSRGHNMFKFSLKNDKN